MNDFRRFGTELDGWTPSLLDEVERRRMLSWEPIVGAVSGGIGDALQAVGVGADTAANIASVATPALIGAGGGALAGAIGGNPLAGALGGGALGALYGGYNVLTANGTTPLAQALGLSGGATPLPGSDASGVTTDAAGNPVTGSSVNANGVPTAKPVVDSSGNVTTSGSSFSPSGVASNAKGISQTQLALGALAALGSALSKNSQQNQPFNATSLPGPSSTAATQGPLFNTPLNATGYLNRTAATPALPGAGYQMAGGTPQSYANSYFNYGPEPTFFSNNNVNLGKSFSRGGAAHGDEPMFRSSGGGADVDGPGDGQSDSVPAKLPDGSFVWNADVVNAFGSGSSNAGKRALEAARRSLPVQPRGHAKGGALSQVNAHLSKDEVVWSPEEVDAVGGGDNQRGAKVLDKVRRKVMSDRGIKSIVPKPVRKSPLQYLAGAA